MSDFTREFLVTGVRSRTHLVHVAAYLRRELCRSADHLELRYVGGGRFLGNAAVTEEDVTSLLPRDERLTVRFVSGAARWVPARTGRLTYIAVGAPGIKPWIALRRNAPARPVHVVVTDEGLGTYGDWRTRRAAWRRQGVPEPWASVRSLGVETAGRTLTSERFALYDRQRSWAIQPDIRAEFLRDVGSVGEPGRARGRVVLLTQPWVTIGATSAPSYLRFVRSVDEAVGAAGKRLQVRPHPAEDPDLYGDFDVLPASRPAELDPAVVGADAVVGGTSTALLNLAALHGLAAARILVPGLEHLEEELGADQRSLLGTYLPPPTVPAELPRLWSTT